MSLFVRLAACAAVVIALSTAAALAWDRSDRAACAKSATDGSATTDCTPR